MKIYLFLIFFAGFSCVLSGQDDPPPPMLVEKNDFPELESSFHAGPDSPTPLDAYPHRVIKSGKYGIVDKRTNVRIPFIYDDLPNVPSNLMVAQRNKSYALINMDNKQLIPFYYNSLQLSQYTPFVFAKSVDNYYMLLDTLGKLVYVKKFYSIVDLEPGRVFGITAPYYGRTKICVIDKTGKLEAELPYSWIKSLGNGRYEASTDSLILSTKFTFASIIDLQGNIIFPLKYNHLGWVKGNWAYAVDYRKKEAGLLNISNGSFKVIKSDEQLSFMDSDSNILYSKGDYGDSKMRYGLFDTLLREIFPPIYNNILKVKGGKYYLLYKEGKAAVANNQGVILTEFKFYGGNPIIKDIQPKHWNGVQISTVESDTFPFIILQNASTSKMALFHHEKGFLFGDTCRGFEIVSASSYILQTEGKYKNMYQLFDLNKMPLSDIYDRMQAHFNRTVLAELDAKVSLLDSQGKLIRPIESDQIPSKLSGDVPPHCYIMRKKNMQALGDQNFKPITEFKYNYISDVNSIPYKWRLNNYNLPGYTEWIAYAKLEDGTQLAIDEKGKEKTITAN